VAESGLLLYIWGYCPFLNWKPASLSPPPSSTGNLYFSRPGELKRGVTVPLNADNCWPVFADNESGWVCIDSGTSGTLCVKLFDQIIIELDSQSQIAKLWLKPRAFPSPA
jgi:hypothetical protein